MIKLKHVTILLALMLSLSANLFAEGLELYGKIYDENSKFYLINDADLKITISGKESNVEYPKSDKGEYRVIEFDVPNEKDVKIQVNHKDFIQSKAITFKTTSFKQKKDIGMLRKNVFAEISFLKAKKIKQNSEAKIDEAFSLVEVSAEISPKPRYYLFLANTIGKRIKSISENGELPSNMALFISNITDDEAFTKFSKDKKKEFHMKIGYYFSKSKNLSWKLIDLKTCLQSSIEAYDNAIQLSPAQVEPYQGKYLVSSRSQNYLDAINVIENYFNTNDPITSESTIKGLLVDWVDLIRSHTGFQGSKREIKIHKSNAEYKKLWLALYKRLKQYNHYYKNSNITGNKNLQDAHLTSKRIVSNG